MLLTEHQRLPTNGARAVLPYTTGGHQYLAIPQLSKDVADTPAHMNGGDSDTGAPIYRWEQGRFVENSTLALSGGEDIASFALDGEQFLVTAGIRAGHGPYRYNLDQLLYRRSGSEWAPFQRFAAFAAKQWYFFQIGKRAFLALAQGVTLGHIEAINPRQSKLFEWNGSQFVEFQELDGKWGYNWESFEIGGRFFLGYADHVGESLLYEWNGTSFVSLQVFATSHGRCFRYFEAGGQKLLAFANIQGDSVLYRWDGTTFTPLQTLSGPGGREFCVVTTNDALFLVQINFIEGEPSAPHTSLRSRIYRWGSEQMDLVEEFPTSGGTDAATFSVDGQRYLAVSNSLTADVRFRTDTIIYKFNA
ncbi:hypothetical protein [Paraburkholderia megapolitana]|uniref:hypothetical protein n=1 Tax=Paraburkholderia megapolitana TaxID=420953 RepID=UPI0038B8B0A2